MAQAREFLGRISVDLASIQPSLLVLGLVAFSAGVLLLASYRRSEFVSDCAAEALDPVSSVDESMQVVTPPDAPIDVLQSSASQVSSAVQVELDIALAENQRLRERLRDLHSHVDHLRVTHSMVLKGLSQKLSSSVDKVVAGSELLQENNLDLAQIESLSNMRLAARVLRDQIEVLNDLSLLESNQLYLEFSEFDLAALLEELCYVAEARELQVSLHISEGLQVCVAGDEKRIGLIVQALLDNAAQYSAQGEIRVSLSSLGRRGSGTSYRIDVQDSGAGIAPEEQLALWKAFAAPEGEATGTLGPSMSVANALVKKMHGSLSVKSRLGEGALFSAELELADVEATHQITPLHIKSENPKLLDMSAIEQIRRQQSPGQPDVVVRAVSAWISSSERTIDDALKAATDEDAARVVTNLVALSSSSAFIGAEAVVAACHQAEKKFSGRVDAPQTAFFKNWRETSLADIEQACSETKPYLHRLVSSAA